MKGGETKKNPTRDAGPKRDTKIPERGRFAHLESTVPETS